MFWNVILLLFTIIPFTWYFLYPTKPGKAYGFGRIVKAGKNLVFLEGHLMQGDKIVVTATSTGVIMNMPGARVNELSKK
jgi:acyl-coenzyme A thioesterase PaaI-like protein